MPTITKEHSKNGGQSESSRVTAQTELNISHRQPTLYHWQRDQVHGHRLRSCCHGDHTLAMGVGPSSAVALVAAGGGVWAKDIFHTVPVRQRDGNNGRERQ